MNDPKIVNLSDIPWTPWASGDGIAVEIRDPARTLGSTHCGLRVYRLAPGCRRPASTGIICKRRCS
jgi:hypothetical protein